MMVEGSDGLTINGARTNANQRGYLLRGYLLRGYLLVESMVSLAVFSIAILGLAALQLTSSKNNLSAMLKTETVVSSSGMIDLMRSNLAGVSAGNYNFSTDVPSSAPGNSPDNNQAQNDIFTWLGELSTVATGFTPESSIACISSTAPSCTIIVKWSDTRALNGLEGSAGDEPTKYTLSTSVNF